MSGHRLALCVLVSLLSSPGVALAQGSTTSQGPGADALVGVELQQQAALKTGSSTTVRYQQRHQGLPVLGSAAVVRVDAHGVARLVAAEVARDLALDTSPALTASQASVRVAALAGVSAADLSSPRLAILPSASGGSLVWEVDAASLLGGERFLIDARSGSLRGRRPLAIEALGRVYKVSAVSTPDPTDEPLSRLDEGAGHLASQGGGLAVFQYTSGGAWSGLSVQPSAGPNSGMDFLYNPPDSAQDPADPFAAVSGYYHAARAGDFFASALSLDLTAKGWDLGVVVNVQEGGKPLENAFFSPLGLKSQGKPNLLALGQGKHDMAADSDLILHEFTHYVSHNAIGYNEGQFGSDSLGFTVASGSVDEGVADYFACSINEDAVFGETLSKGLQRDLASGGMRCPDDLSGEVHEDGRLIGSTAWALRGALGREAADALVWSATTTMTRGASLQDFAAALLDAAAEMSSAGQLSPAQVADLKVTLDARGLADCGRSLSLNTGARTVKLKGLAFLGKYFGESCEQMQAKLALPSSFQFTFRPGVGATQARLRVSMEDPDGEPVRWSLLVNQGRPVSFHPSASGYPQAEEADFKLEGQTGASGELILGEGAAWALDPDARYHAVLVHQGCAGVRMRIEATSDGEPREDQGPSSPAETSTIPPSQLFALPTGGGVALDGVVEERAAAQCSAPRAPGARWPGAWLLGALCAGIAWRRARPRG